MPHRDIPRLKARVPMRAVVEAHPGPDPLVGDDDKVRCPFHDDRTPSCHVYPDGFKCFGCGAYGDAIDWLEQVGGFGTAEAIDRLAALAESVPLPRGAPERAPRRRMRDDSRRPLTGRVVDRYRRWLERTRRLPTALRGRSLTLADAHTLGLAARGDDAVLPIHDLAGRLVALKRRHAGADGGPRYSYLAGGHGTPAWCSPRAADAQVVFVVEGELNAMVVHLAFEELGFRIGVIGAAGVHGDLPAAALAGADALLWTDADEAGARAIGRWTVAARRAGVRSVRALPRARSDACEFAARRGRPALARALLRAMLRASYDPAAGPGAAFESAADGRGDAGRHRRDDHGGLAGDGDPPAGEGGRGSDAAPDRPNRLFGLRR